MFDLKIFCFKR